MKVQITKESKRVITLATLEAAKRMVKELKEDETSVEEYAKMAARVIMGAPEVLKAEAEITTNRRVWEQYGEGSEDLDVWIRFAAVDRFHCYCECGIYLSDVWSISGDNKDEIKAQMFIAQYNFVQF